MTRNPWKSELHWRKQGQQDRAHRSQNRVLDAAEMLFFENGYDATSVADLAKKAGCSIGSVYHNFKDKKAIAFALFDRMTNEFEATSLEAVDPARWEGAKIIDILKGYIRFSIVNNKERPGFKSAALEAVRLDPSLAKHFPTLQSRLYRGLQQLLLARRSEIGHPDPESASAYAIDLLTAQLRARLDPPARSSQLSKLSDKQFAEQAVGLVSGYLQLQF